MAITINSPATANISDTQSSLSVTVGGTIREILDILLKVNGVTVAALYDIPTATGTFTFDSTIVQAIYNAAKGYPLGSCVSISAFTRNSDGSNAAAVTLDGGALTINYRIKNLSLSKPTTTNKWDMDLVSGNLLTSSWTRTNSAFFARLKGYVWNGSSWVLVFNRYGWTTSSNIDVIAYGYKDAIVAAMNGVSPRDFKLQIITQFDDGTADYLDLSYTESEVTGNYTKRTTTYSVSKIFVTLSTIAIGNFELLPIAMSVPFNLTTSGSYPHTIRLYLKKPDGTSVLIKTQSVSAGVTSGSFAIDATERNIILNALPGSTYATTYAEVDTDTYGTTDSKSVATTLTLNADFKPSIGTVTWAEVQAYVKAALGYGVGTPFFLMSKSQVLFTVPVTNAVGATTASIRVQFAGTDKTQATSPITTDLLNSSGSLMATVTVTDSRGRSATFTTSAITVRPYKYPNVDKFEVYRSDSSGVYDPTTGTYLRCVIKGTATTVKALDGTTEKNWIKYKIDYRVKNTGSYSNNAAVVPGGLTFGELTTAALAGFTDSAVYDVRLRVFDAFFDLDNDGSTLEDTDDYAEGITPLPSCDVSMMLGKRYASFGKKYGGVGTVDVGQDTNGISINADGKIQSGGIELIKRVDMVVTDFNAIDPSTLIQGRIYTFNTGFQAANRPTSENYHAGFLQVHNISGKNATLFCYSTGYGVYIRYWNGTTWSGWVREWNDRTDGSGSGLDADLIDAYQLKGPANSIASDGILANGSSGMIGDSCAYYKGTTTTVANTTEVQIPVDTLLHNSNTALFTLASGVLTVKKAGLYLIVAYIRSTSGTAGGRLNTAVWKNATAFSPVSGGTQYILGTIGQVASQPTGMMVPIVLQLAANDTLTMSAYTTGAGVTIGSGIVSNLLEVTKLA